MLGYIWLIAIVRMGTGQSCTCTWFKVNLFKVNNLDNTHLTYDNDTVYIYMRTDLIYKFMLYITIDGW